MRPEAVAVTVGGSTTARRRPPIARHRPRSPGCSPSDFRGHDGVAPVARQQRVRPGVLLRRLPRRLSAAGWPSGTAICPTVNEAWGTNVWGNTLTDWSEIELPSVLNAMEPATRGRVAASPPSPSIALDHARFCSAVLLECFLNEQGRCSDDRTPGVPVTTNFHGPVQVVDWHEWAAHVDLVAWDSYPLHRRALVTCLVRPRPRRGAGRLRRVPDHGGGAGAGQLARPLCPQAPGPGASGSASGGRPRVPWHVVLPDPPGAGRRRAQPLGVDPANWPPRYSCRRRADPPRETSCRALGCAAGRPTRSAARIAVIFDWASWWGHHNTPGLDQRSRYLDTVRDTHRALVERGRVVDVIASAGPFDRYEVVVAPLLHVVGAHDGQTRSPSSSSGGGVLITTTRIGHRRRPTVRFIRRESNRRGARLLGLWIEETDVQATRRRQPRPLRRWHDRSRAVSCSTSCASESAVPIAEFEDDFYAGAPAVTTNAWATGRLCTSPAWPADVVAAVVERCSMTSRLVVSDGPRHGRRSDVAVGRRARLSSCSTTATERRPVTLDEGTVDRRAGPERTHSDAIDDRWRRCGRPQEGVQVTDRCHAGRLLSSSPLVDRRSPPTASTASPIEPILGVDLSYVNEMEDCGGQFTRRDPRRPVHDPGRTRRQPRPRPAVERPGLDRLQHCRRRHPNVRARARPTGMQTLLDFHYSDEWADPSRQNPPAAWDGDHGRRRARRRPRHATPTETSSSSMPRACCPTWCRSATRPTAGSSKTPSGLMGATISPLLRSRDRAAVRAVAAGDRSADRRRSCTLPSRRTLSTGSSRRPTPDSPTST